MPTLNWIGKDKVVSHHQDVPYRVLEHKYGFTVDSGDQSEPTNSGNKIIHGDNLEALKSLLPEYEGKIKCIYIDPPYNTGNEGWTYNDNVNHPKINKWLLETLKAKENDKVAAIGVDDLTRHDKWLCMMYPRLKLLHKLLDDNGAIFMSIDDNEQANLKLIANEIFGETNFIGEFIWTRKKKGAFLSKKIRKMTEYVLCYQKSGNESLELYGEDAYSDKWQPIVKRTNSTKILEIDKNIIETTLEDGIYNLGFKGKIGTGVNFLNDFEVKDNIVVTKIQIEGNFVWTQEFLDSELLEGTRISLSTKFGFNVLRHNQSEKFKAPSTILNSEIGIGSNEDASQDLTTIFNSEMGTSFNYSKPTSLVEFLIKSITYNDLNAIVLDSFAGSGTTAHSVLNLNQKDQGNRKFILVEMENYANSITAERVKIVTQGYGTGGNKKEGTGGAFDYYELGLPLFNEDQNLNEQVDVEKILEYIWFSETRTPFRLEKNEPYFLGKKDESAYYFIYEKDRLTTLDFDALELIKTKSEQYVIYADNCLLPKEFMANKNIIFKKIPRDITRF
jgi:adenine-specific DNA-methyltransferase